jgi:tRNA pseudouridine38-40 synthase
MATAPRLVLRVAYLGGGFAGWQRQAGARTVQGDLEDALARLYRAPVAVRGAGRTDAGVHAAGQVAHLDPPFAIPAAGVRSALNALLRDDVRVLSVRRAPPGFDARRSARAKRYRYRLAWGEPLEPWEALRCWQLSSRPDLARMRRALAEVVGTRDFAAFASSGHSGTGARGTTRTILSARLSARGRRAAVVLEGDGFLRGMARRIVGALVEVGRGAQPPSWFAGLLRDPRTAPPAPTAPARGLTLEHVRCGGRPARVGR